MFLMENWRKLYQNYYQMPPLNKSFEKVNLLSSDISYFEVPVIVKLIQFSIDSCVNKSQACKKGLYEYKAANAQISLCIHSQGLQCFAWKKLYIYI